MVFDTCIAGGTAAASSTSGSRRSGSWVRGQAAAPPSAKSAGELGGVGGMSQVSKSVTGVAGANGDARIYALDFQMDRGYYDKIPFGLAGAAGSLPELAGQRAAAQENACTLLMWYVTKLFQPDTGIARGGSGGRQDEPGLRSVCSGIQSSDPSDSPSAASTKVVEGNIMMWYGTERTRFVTAWSAAW